MSKGTYTFKWSQPGDEVFVTGSFDDWKKTEKLAKTVDGTHLASVELPIEKITYKYVVDGTWTVDATQRIEKDASGNENNYLLPEDIAPKDEPVFTIPVIPDTAEGATPFVQSTGPHATTADLAAEVPLEPPRDLAAEEAAEAAVAPAPAVVKDEPAEASIMVSSVGPEATTAALAAEVPLEEVAKQEPIVPEATKAVVAPEDLPTPDPKSVPGFLPDTFEPVDQVVSVNPIPASETADNPIHLEPNEPVPPSTASVTDNVKLDKESYEHADASNLGVGATASAALAAVTEAITSAATTATETAKNLIPESVLPIVTGGEPATGETAPDHTTATTETVPEVVVESQVKAGVEPEASGVPEAVEHKQEVEKEIVEKTELAAPIEVTTENPHAEVPEVVRESQVEANAPLEASASPVAVEAKKEIEAELKSEVKPVEPIAEQPTEKPSEIPAVPEVVVGSMLAAGASPEAAANPAAVEAKHEVEEAIVHQAKPAEEPVKKEGEPSTAAEPAAVEPAKKEEEPSTVEKAVAAADKVVDKVADKPADKAPSEKNSKKESTSDKAGKEKNLKKRRRISAFFKKLLK
ncbi:hypothetical protein TWF696_002083 [Orbilia brochopaga]|uniref:AMP-activated protein kinase glycogen-binding domain-containing protein n=1 Tax=Orbilia brochopaga TaxID=3140254 RepID=A0AAV9U7C6_9PEZI